MEKVQEKKLDVAEMRMLRWMIGVTKLDRMTMRKKRIGGTTKVGEIAKREHQKDKNAEDRTARKEETGKVEMALVEVTEEDAEDRPE